MKKIIAIFLYLAFTTMFLIHLQETRRVENVLGRVSLGGEKHRTDKRGATERALETTLAPSVSSKLQGPSK